MELYGSIKPLSKRLKKCARVNRIESFSRYLSDILIAEDGCKKNIRIHTIVDNKHQSPKQIKALDILYAKCNILTDSVTW